MKKTESTPKIVIRCVPAVRYEGAREAARELGVSYASLYAYLAYGTPSIGPDKRARLESVGVPRPCSDNPRAY